MKINFEKHLVKGERSYDTRVGEWWLKKSYDRAHIRAYKNIARLIARSSHKPPKFFVDYACGSGAALAQLAPLMPKTRIVALDGSKKMLMIGKARLNEAGFDAELVKPANAFSKRGPQIRLVHTPLPWDGAPAGVADAAMLLFPNLNSTTARQKLAQKNWIGNNGIESAARLFSHIREADAKEHDPDQVFDELILERAVAENIRHMLKAGRKWFKVDYANALREDLDEIDHWKLLFSESAIDIQIARRTSRASFKLIKNVYYRSAVIMDVYDQTKDPSDKTGGYIFSVFEAL